MNKVDYIVKILDDRKAENIKVIDISQKNSIGEYFVIATANSINQSRALADHLEENLEKEGYKIYSIEGLREGNRILIDTGDIIVHIFTENQRNYYNIEDLREEE